MQPTTACVIIAATSAQAIRLSRGNRRRELQRRRSPGIPDVSDEGISTEVARNNEESSHRHPSTPAGPVLAKSDD
jgi:hypothetical protein